jgi:hypothetical protein
MCSTGRSPNLSITDTDLPSVLGPGQLSAIDTNHGKGKTVVNVAQGLACSEKRRVGFVIYALGLDDIKQTALLAIDLGFYLVTLNSEYNANCETHAGLCRHWPMLTFLPGHSGEGQGEAELAWQS